MTRFLEESPGVWSMTRLAILWLLILATALVGTMILYVLCYMHPDAAVLGTLGVALSAVVYKGAVAIKNRNSPDDDK